MDEAYGAAGGSKAGGPRAVQLALDGVEINSGELGWPGGLSRLKGGRRKKTLGWNKRFGKNKKALVGPVGSGFGRPKVL